MNKRNKKLIQKKNILSKKIKNIKNIQSDLVLKNILLDSKREELEQKKLAIERLISYSGSSGIPNQKIVIRTESTALSFRLYHN